MIRLYTIVKTDTEGFTEPVTLTEVKTWIGGLDADHDTLLTSMIAAARQDVEQYLNVRLINSSVSLFLSMNDTDELPVLPFALAMPAEVTVNKIVKGAEDATMTVDEDYYLNGSFSINESGRYKLEYSLTPTVPSTIKEAIKMLIAYRFANRGDNEKQIGLPEDVISKIHPYKQMWL